MEFYLKMVKFNIEENAKVASANLATEEGKAILKAAILNENTIHHR